MSYQDVSWFRVIRRDYYKLRRSLIEGIDFLIPDQDIGDYVKFPVILKQNIRNVSRKYALDFTTIFEVVIKREIERAFIEAHKQLKFIGKDPIPLQKDGFIDTFYDTFKTIPFYEKTVDDRIGTTFDIFYDALLKIVRKHWRNKSTNTKLKKELTEKLSGTSNGGGISPIKWATRLLMGEAHRVYCDTIVHIAMINNIRFLKWVLNPYRKAYDGICEHYATATDEEITGIIKREQPEPGVYDINHYPEIVYPSCGCFPLIYA